MNATKKFVVLFDGTCNEYTYPEKTNVASLYDRIAKKTDRQEVHVMYENGVGTRLGEAISGATWGDGIDERLKGAYRWLTDLIAYQTKGFDDYEIFVFGFSRGAYIARTFCWLLSYCGIPEKSNQCEALYRLFESKKYNQIQKTVKKSDTVKMLGIWDTVKTAHYKCHHDTALAPNVLHAYHAMSLDELRSTFPVTRIEVDHNDCAREVWFAGSHSDIVGGYPEKGLSNITLKWMLENAMEYELEFLDKPLIVENFKDPIHDETQNMAWKLLGQHKRTVHEGDLVHVSVKHRLACLALNYTPNANFPVNPNFVDY